MGSSCHNIFDQAEGVAPTGEIGNNAEITTGNKIVVVKNAKVFKV